MRKTTYPDGATASTTYDAISQIKTVTDERGNVSQYEYDAAGRQTKVINALNKITEFTYDANGNQRTIKDANGNSITHEYDAANRLTRIVYPDSTERKTDYDALGRRTAETDQAGRTTQFGYDKLGRLTKVTDALNQATSYTYDEVGNRTSQTDANNRITTFEYDKVSHRTKRTLPLGMSEIYTYDVAGNVENRTDFRGKTTTYSYDAMNRLKSKTPDPSLNQPQVNFSYTATGQRAMMNDASGSSSYIYDRRDRLMSNATPQGTLSYTYDTAGNLVTVRSLNSNGVSVNYTYDKLNRLSTVLDNRLANGTTTYSYDLVGNIESYIYANGVKSAYSYNSLNRLTNLTISKTSNLASYAYTLGPSGNRLSVTERSGRKVNYGYDALYRLTSETITNDPVVSNNGVISYKYDKVGNRLSRNSSISSIPSATSTYDANDRLTDDVYDANGNTIGSNGNVYAYDFENRLTNFNAGDTTYVYDGDGNRVAKTVLGITKKYLVDTNNLTGYAQVVEEVVNGNVQRVYTYGHDLISQNQLIIGNWTVSFYGYDGHGSVRFLTNSAGTITDAYDYDAFGNLIASAGNTPNDYLFSGEQYDPNIGFYYLRARYHSPSNGRFLTTDPLLGQIYDPISLHSYVYAADDPVNKSDPTGLYTLLDVTLANALRETLANVQATIGFKTLNIVEAKVTGAKIKLFSVYDLLPLLPSLFRLRLPVPTAANPSIGGPLVQYTDEIAAEFNYVFRGELSVKVQLSSGARVTVALDALRLKHILNAHTYEFFYLPGAGSLNTGWPRGTSPSRILQLLVGALRNNTLRLGNNIVNVEGFTVQLPIRPSGQIPTFFPLSGPGVIPNIRNLFP